jgi:tetratricopeptide (TPR) repeat protein
LDNTHQKAIIKIAKHFLIKRENDLVEIYVNKGLENYADNPALLSLKAQNYYWKEDYINAIKWFEKLLTLGESSEFIHEKLSLCYAQEYEYEKAIEHRKIVLKYSPNDVTSMYVLGTYYQKVKDFENAEKYIKQFILLSNIPFDEEYTKLGRIYNQQKKYKEAIEMFQMALKEDSSNVSAQFFLVRSKDEYYADLDAKIKLYEDFKVKYPKHPYLPLAEMRLSELKKEKFLDKD